MAPCGGEARALHDPIESVDGLDLPLKDVGVLGLSLLVKVGVALVGVLGVLLRSHYMVAW